MRIRPIFWLLLAFSCASVLLFAALWKPEAPAILQVHMTTSTPAAGAMTTVALRITDTEGTPIEAAQVQPGARMTNMDMGAPLVRVNELGQGNYQAQLKLSMAGPWQISIAVSANGFQALHQTFLVQVE